MTSAAQECYVEAVLASVESIPAGRVASYGDVAAHVGAVLGRGGPRQVGTVLARYGGTVAWWRVVRADGRPATNAQARALQRLRAEGTPLVADRVQLAVARWDWPAGPEPLTAVEPDTEPCADVPRGARFAPTDRAHGVSSDLGGVQG